MDFTTIFNQLTGNQQCLIINTMVEMEHCTPPKKISIANGIRYGMRIKGLTQEEMLTLIIPIYFEKIGYDGNDSVSIKKDMQSILADMQSILSGEESIENHKKLSKRYEEVRKKYTISIENDLKYIENIYKSMIIRNSRKSKLYPIVLKFLDIDEDLITSAYFSNLSATELFSSLSPRNQSAILYLMKNFETDFNLVGDIKSIGVISGD